MNRYACIVSGVLSYLLTADTQPVDIPHKSVVFLPCPVVNQPAYDPTVKKLTGPTYVIGPTSVVQTWTLTDLTPSELDDAKKVEMSNIGVATLQGLFNHENRIRVLEGKSTITLATFLTAIKNLL